MRILNKIINKIKKKKQDKLIKEILEDLKYYEDNVKPFFDKLEGKK